MTKDPETLPQDMPVADAIRFFEGARHRSYPVIDAAGRPVAIASRADALRWRQADIAPEVTLRDQLSDGSLPAVRPETPAIEVANLMIAEEIGRVCVIAPEDGRLVGLIARRNLLAARATKAREEKLGRRRAGRPDTGLSGSAGPR
jgi:CBS domain-containing protein